jgi:fumarate reductase (CoM/CoB) subunit A
MGGLKINDKCETNVKGMFACGETAGGVHGANRLAGNALAETLVFGEIAGKNASEFALKNDFDNVDTKNYVDSLPKLVESSSEKKLIRDIREIMWIYLGIIRDEKGIKTAIKQFTDLKHRFEKIDSTENYLLYFKLRNIIFVAQALAISALERTESRGAHYRSDFPKENKDWKKAIVIKKGFDIGYEAR